MFVFVFVFFRVFVFVWNSKVDVVKSKPVSGPHLGYSRYLCRPPHLPDNIQLNRLCQTVSARDSIHFLSDLSNHDLEDAVESLPFFWLLNIHISENNVFFGSRQRGPSGSLYYASSTKLAFVTSGVGTYTFFQVGVQFLPGKVNRIQVYPDNS